MKVLGIACSPREEGNTEILVKRALTGSKEEGAETEILIIAEKDINPCDGCRTCEKTHECHIDDDMQWVYTKLLEADGIIIGTPVYFWNVSGQAKVFMDRTYALRYPHYKLGNKVGAALAVAGNTGAMAVLNNFHTFFVRGHHMFVSDMCTGLATERGEIKKDKKAMAVAYEVGRQVVQLIEKKPEYPEEFNKAIYELAPEKHDVFDRF